MKYLLNHYRNNAPQNFLFMGIELNDVTSSPVVESNQENTESPTMTKEKAFDEKSAEAMNILKTVLTGKNPLIQKRILNKFNKECGLDDGIINANDDLAKKDAPKIPARLPKELLPYDHTLDENQEIGGAFVENSPAIKNSIPSLVADGKIDQGEYQNFVESFSQNAEKITNEVKNEPLYKEEIGDMQNFPGVDEALEGVTDEGMRTLLLEQIKNDILYSKTPKTLSQTESYLKEFKTNRKDYMKWCRLSAKRENLEASEKLIFEKLRKNISTNLVEKIAKAKVDNVANKYSPWGPLVRTKDFTPKISGRNSLRINIFDANLSVRIPEEFFLETGLDVQESKTFIENNWDDILNSIALANKLDQSFDEKSPTEYPHDPSIERNQRGAALVAAGKEAEKTAQEVANTNREAAREQARNAENEDFLSSLTQGDVARLEVSFKEGDTAFIKVQKIQAALAKKEFTPSNSQNPDGTWDGWAGTGTKTAFLNFKKSSKETTPLNIETKKIANIPQKENNKITMRPLETSETKTKKKIDNLARKLAKSENYENATEKQREGTKSWLTSVTGENLTQQEAEQVLAKAKEYREGDLFALTRAPDDKNELDFNKIFKETQSL